MANGDDENTSIRTGIRIRDVLRQLRQWQRAIEDGTASQGLKNFFELNAKLRRLSIEDDDQPAHLQARPEHEPPPATASPAGQPQLTNTPLATESRPADEVIREEIRIANQESENRGERYWPNCKVVAKTVHPRVTARGVKATRAQIEDIAVEEPFKAKRRKPGQTF